MSQTIVTCPRCQAKWDTTTYRNPFCSSCQFPLILLAGKYRLTKILDQGGVGTVYLANHIGLDFDTERAIKVIRFEALTNEGMLQRFRREVQVTAALSQRNEHIIRIYDDFGLEANLGYYYVMEYLQGTSLKQYRQHTGPFSLPLTLHVFQQLCKAMGAAHKQGVIHRDIKPANLFLIQRGNDPFFLKVLDFGIAKSLTFEAQSQITQGALGTPAYMSPEQCMGREIDAGSDIYAMAIILYEMLTDSRLFNPAEAHPFAMMNAHIYQAPAPILERRPELSIPEEMDRAILRALAKEPKDRYQSADEFWYHLASTLSSSILQDLQHFQNHGEFRAFATPLSSPSGASKNPAASASPASSPAASSSSPSVMPAASPLSAAPSASSAPSASFFSSLTAGIPAKPVSSAPSALSPARPSSFLAPATPPVASTPSSPFPLPLVPPPSSPSTPSIPFPPTPSLSPLKPPSSRTESSPSSPASSPLPPSSLPSSSPQAPPIRVVRGNPASITQTPRKPWSNDPAEDASATSLPIVSPLYSPKLGTDIALDIESTSLSFLHLSSSPSSPSVPASESDPDDESAHPLARTFLMPPSPSEASSPSSFESLPTSKTSLRLLSRDDKSSLSSKSIDIVVGTALTDSPLPKNQTSPPLESSSEDASVGEEEDDNETTVLRYSPYQPPTETPEPKTEGQSAQDREDILTPDDLDDDETSSRHDPELKKAFATLPASSFDFKPPSPLDAPSLAPLSPPGPLSPSISPVSKESPSPPSSAATQPSLLSPMTFSSPSPPPPPPPSNLPKKEVPFPAAPSSSSLTPPSAASPPPPPALGSPLDRPTWPPSLPASSSPLPPAPMRPNPLAETKATHTPTSPAPSELPPPPDLDSLFAAVPPPKKSKAPLALLVGLIGILLFFLVYLLFFRGSAAPPPSSENASQKTALKPSPPSPSPLSSAPSRPPLLVSDASDLEPSPPESSPERQAPPPELPEADPPPLRKGKRRLPPRTRYIPPPSRLETSCGSPPPSALWLQARILDLQPSQTPSFLFQNCSACRVKTLIAGFCIQVPETQKTIHLHIKLADALCKYSISLPTKEVRWTHEICEQFLF